ncbi:MAG: hypothetical protein ACXW17_19180, partial [Methylomagnum sp.]
YLRDKANEAGKLLLATHTERDDWERGIEKADSHNDVGNLLRFGILLSKQRQEMEGNPCWSQADVTACDQLLAPLREMIAAKISDWIPRQSCNTVAQVSDFRHRIEKAVASLKELGFKREAGILEQQSQRAIMQVEERQKFSLTLAESDDYPRQPDPTDSTPVRELRDALTQGDRLIESIKAAATALSPDEITARINAVKRRQERLKATIGGRRQTLGELYSLAIASQTILEETLVKARRLREIFIDTPDQQEISDIVAQLERVREDISAWESGDFSPERLAELLQQRIQHQVSATSDFLEANEIDPAWSLEPIYQAIATDRITAQQRRSTEWILPRRELTNQFQSMDLNRCSALERELMAAPTYLASDDREQAERLLTAIQNRRMELLEEARRSQVVAWQAPFLSFGNIEAMDQYETERLLKKLRNPPVELRPEEQVSVEAILLRLMNRLDQISLNEIIGRIERLSVDQQRQVFSILSERLAA